MSKVNRDKKSDAITPKTEMQLLEEMFEQLGIFFHPRIIESLRKQMFKVLEERERESYANIGISEDARWLDSELKSYKQINDWVEQGNDHLRTELTGRYKWLYKKFIERYTKKQ